MSFREAYFIFLEDEIKIIKKYKSQNLNKILFLQETINFKEKRIKKLEDDLIKKYKLSVFF